GGSPHDAQSYSLFDLVTRGSPATRSGERLRAPPWSASRIGTPIGLARPPPRRPNGMSDSNPYVEARREWNDRYLDLVRERRTWQLVAGAELLALVVLAGGFVWLSLQHKTVPYVVEVDSLGAALAIKPVESAARPTDERVIRYQLAAFIRGSRQVMTDRIAM